MDLSTFHLLNENGFLSNESSLTIDKEILLKGYRAMLITRLVDARMITLQRQGLISFALSSLGEEACAVASAAALDNKDWLYPQYREAGIMFWRGFSIQDYIHHMFCNAKDLNLGRQMPNHFGSKALNVVTVSSPIGTKIPHAAGAAYAMKLKKEDSITVCYFGEGATSEGDFHVGLNFAAVRKAPVIFFCRNNGYAISTPLKNQFLSKDVAIKGLAYGIESFKVDGNDFFAVYAIVKKAREICLTKQCPILIEAVTYRAGAHSTSDDPTLYRLEAENEQWQKLCPITRLKHYLIRQNLWSEELDQKEIEEINREITASIEVAKNTSLPPLESMIENVYFEVPQSLKDEFEEIKIIE
ncbi:MAG: 3-methyl-2-oxobutanoate dehydrogenase [Chlamydia sp. 32-24]|mgnify:CR=1 FL=1|nr:MAG: 3-methyl-2-oxobutanoate dehydrogenase [Chlamydia sp. 32-24]